MMKTSSKKVADLMTRSVVQLPSETPVAEAAKAMKSRQIGDVVVIEGGRMAGVVTDRDIVVRAIAEDRDPRSTPLRDVVSDRLVTIDQEATAAAAADLMRQHAVRRLVVTKTDGSLTGIVSIGDLAVDLDPRSALGEISKAEPNG
jgi:CBS domain-containing protein